VIMRVPWAILLSAGLLLAPDVSGQPMAVTCITESGAPCSVDQRPPVSGREAERNLRRANRERELPDGARLFDMRNGRFVIVTAPQFSDIGSGYCSNHVEDNSVFPRSWYVHAEMSSADCERAAQTFSEGGMTWSLGGQDSIRCEALDAAACFSAVRRLRQVVEEAERDDRVQIAGFARERQRNLVTARSLARMPRPFVFTPIEGNRWGCARVGATGFGLGDTEVMVCDSASEGGESSTTIYVSGPYMH